MNSEKAAPDSLVSRTLWSGLGTLAAAAGRMVAGIAIARQLGPELAGRYAFLVWCVEFGILLFAFGLPSALTRHMAELDGRGGGTEERRTLIAWVVRRSLGVNLCGALGLSLAAVLWLDYAASDAVTPLLGLTLLLQAVSGLTAGYLAGQQNFSSLAKLNIASGLVLALLQPVLTASLGLTGALAGFAVSCSVALIWAPSLLRIAVRPGPARVASSVERYALYTWLATIASAVVWARTEIFFLERFGQAGEAGYFSAGLSLSMLVGFGATMLTSALMPHFSCLAGRADQGAIQRDYSRLTIVVALYALPAGLIGAALIPELVPMFYGDAFRPAVAPTMVLMASGALVVAGVGSSLRYGVGRAGFDFYWGVASALVMLTGCTLVIPEGGALGAAWVRLGVQTLSVLVTTLFMYRWLGLRPPLEALGHIALAALGGAVVAAPIVLYSPLWPLPAGIAAGGATYLLLLRHARILAADDARLLEELVSQRGGRLGNILGVGARWAFRCR